MPPAAVADSAPRYVRRLGRFDGLMICVGGIVGAGIFLNPSIVAQRVATAAEVMLAWALGGVVALAGAFCFAELGARDPRAGGGYVYLRRAFGPLPAFLYGWTLLLVINSGAIAAVAEIAARYAVRAVGAGDGPVLPLTLAAIAALTAVNYFGIVPGARLQNAFTLLKMAALLLVVAVGARAGLAWLSFPEGAGAGAAVAHAGGAGGVAGLGAALVPVMFAMGGWQNTNFVAGEVREPGRTLPFAIVGGVVVVVAAYLAVNAAYLAALGHGGLAASRAPAADLLLARLGRAGELVISLGIVVSTLGILNVFILAAPRVYRAMADDGLFFRAASRLHPRYRSPAGALWFQAVWASLLAATGTYAQLLDYVVFGDWIFFGLVGATVFVYRRRGFGGRAVAFRAPALPLTAGVFVAAAVAIVAGSIRANPGNALLGGALIAAGLPVFALWRRR